MLLNSNINEIRIVMRPSLHSTTIYFPTPHLISTPLHFTSLHFTALSMIPPSFRLIYHFPNPFPKITWLTEEIP
jgi:hypothetical protein